MIRVGARSSKMHFRTQEMNFFTIFLQVFYHSEFDGDCVSLSLGYAKQENHEKKNSKNFKGGEATTKIQKKKPP